MAKNKKVCIVEGDVPQVAPGNILIQTLYSVISPGTEATTIRQSKDHDRSLGYSAVGEVLELGENVEGFAAGDLVACYGGPYVHHNEVLAVPKTLCAKAPENIDVKEAALAGIGAISIHALRKADLRFGETVVIAGLGLFGQLIAKIANAAAYRVIAYDIHKERADMLNGDKNIETFSNVKDMEAAIAELTDGYGVDAVLLCAGGGEDSPLPAQSLSWIRDQGKVVIVGDIEPNFPRGPMFGKEAEILISRAGGPGRYDPIYEAQAIDYPYGFVRWTEGRNVTEYIRLLAEERINVRSFVQHEVHFDEAPKAYDELLQKDSNVLTKVIKYF